MLQSRISLQDQKLAAERRLKYRGTAIIRLESLHFPCDATRELNRKNVDRLKKCFRKEGCRRLEVENHIPATIDESRLQEAVTASGFRSNDLLTNQREGYPELKLPPSYRLTCLHGQHRIQAAREVLAQRNAWWAVDLYVTGRAVLDKLPRHLLTLASLDTSDELKTVLIEEYSNQEPPSDGEIYYKIRLYDREGSLLFKNRWEAFLSDYGRRCLDQITKRDILSSAVDALVAIPGLRPGLRFSSISKAISKKCYEVSRFTF